MLKKIIEGLIERGTATHSKKGRHIGVSVLVSPELPVFISNSYEAREPIARDLSWKMGDDFVSFIPEKISFDCNIWYIILYSNKELYILKSEGCNLREIIENGTKTELYHTRHTWYTIENMFDGEKTNELVKEHSLTFQKSAGWSGKLPWAVWLAFPLAWITEGYCCDFVDAVCGSANGRIEDSRGNTHKLKFGYHNYYQHWSGDRFQIVTTTTIISTNQPKIFTFKYVEKEQLVVLETPEGITAKGIDPEAFITGNINTLLGRVVRKLYEKLGEQKTRQSSYWAKRKDTKNIVYRKTISLGMCKQNNWCCAGTLKYLRQHQEMLNQYKRAGLDIASYIYSQQWEEIPQEILTFKLFFSLEEAKEYAGKEGYYFSAFTIPRRNRQSMYEYNEENINATIGRAIMKH